MLGSCAGDDTDDDDDEYVSIAINWIESCSCCIPVCLIQNECLSGQMVLSEILQQLPLVY